MYRFKNIFLFLLFGVFLFSSCDKKGKEAEKTPYWRLSFQPGNFSINNQDITINKDAASVNHTADYLKKADLPDAPFQVYHIKFYMPTSTDSFKLLTDSASVTITVNNTSTNITTTIVSEAIKVIDNASYAVIEIAGTDAAGLGTKDDFQNVSFSLYVHYIDLATNSNASNRHVIADLYKKE